MLAQNALTQGYAINAVFGGGNLASFTPDALHRTSRSALVHVYHCDNTIRDLYGGGNAADIGTSTVNADVNLTVDGGRFQRVFGGGNGEVSPANIYGAANTTIEGGLIDELYGGGNSQGNISATNLVVNEAGSCAMMIGEIFGGGNEVPIIGDVVTTLECGDQTYGSFYGGANLASIFGNVTVNVFGGTFNNFFAGSRGRLANPSANPPIEEKSADILDNPATTDIEEGYVL